MFADNGKGIFECYSRGDGYCGAGPFHAVKRIEPKRFKVTLVVDENVDNMKDEEEEEEDDETISE